MYRLLALHARLGGSPSTPPGGVIRRIGPVWRGTSLALRSNKTSRSSERFSQPGGTGANRRSAPASDSKVNQPLSNPGFITAPVTGRDFHTCRLTPLGSEKFLLAMDRS